MSAINSNSDSEKSRDISENNYNNISSDSSTSTFEFIEGSIYANERSTNFRTNRPIIWSSTKEEKQKHNEEIAVMDSNFEPSSSWEKIEVSDIQKEELEACRNFLTNERSFNSIGISRPSTSTKPCFIDASSLLDDDYVPVPFPRTTKIESSADNRHGTTSFLSYNENMHRNESRNHEIKDQYSAIQTHHHIPRNYRPNNNNTNISSREQHDEYEKHQGRLIFQNNNVQQRVMASEDYASDISFPSEYSSGSTCGTYNNLIYDTTSGYSGSTNYSRIPSDVESMTFPDTPFNSIVQLSKKLEVCSIDDDDEEINKRSTSSPVQIPKRIMKHDESAPILSGGASVNDFAPKHCESPSVRRKTDSCPIVSGGSLDIEEEPVQKPIKNNDSDKLSYSWVVDLSSNNSQVDEESGCNSRQEFDEHHTPSKSSSSSTPKNSLGFYVDFSSLEPLPEDTKPIAAAKKRDDLRKQSLKKSTGFFVDFSSSSDASHPNTPKQNTNTEDNNINNKRRDSDSDRSTNMFNMFVDFENTSEPTDKVVEECSSLIKDDSNNDITNVETTSTVVASSSKKGCFMFIENDCHVVKHRKILPKEPSKRHSWNVQTNEFDDIKTNTKVYQRSTSVTSNDEKFIPSSLPVVYSKTSSMSIGSSISPHEDFSCSKSLSSRSNLSISTSNTSIDNSETKVQQCNDLERNLLKKRRKEAKINETYDKSSQGSVTDEIFSNEDNRTSSDTDDDLTFQNPKDDNNTEQAELELKRRESSLLEDIKVKMDTIVETSENSSPFKKAVNNEKPSDNLIDNDLKLDPPLHTMESLQQLIEKQKQILENVAEPPNISSPPSSPFVKLSDLDKPTIKKDYPMMTTSAGYRTSMDNHQKYQSSPSDVKTMSRSTGNNMINLASSVENSKSLSRLFPHLSKVFSSSVPSNVGFNISSMDQSLYEYIEFISSDFSCTSSINSSRSGMESADESSISCRQPRRLGEDLLKMFLQEIGTDVVIDVDGRKIKAHKIILSSRCQYFAAILAGKWIENTGNVITLTGYSYNTVHFALCHVYSGAAHVPSGLDLMELASLSDCLGLEGLKEVTGYALKTNYCHNFHKPCSGCIDGIVQVLSVTLDHGFDDLYRKCLKWLCKHFCKVWVTRSFGNLTFDLMLRCSQQITAHFSSENVLNWLLDCEEVLETLNKSRWESFETQNVVEIVLEAAHEYILDHFSSLIASDSFLSLGHDRKDDIPKLEHFILKAATSLSPDQACKSYPRAVRLNALLNAKLIKFPSPLSNDSFKPQFDHIQLRDEDEDIEWNDEFIKLVSALLSAVEQSLIRQCGKAMKCSAWQRMDGDLRSKIQKIACVTENDDMRRNLRSSVTSLGSASSATTNRANDLRQVKLAIQAHKLLHENQAYANKTHPAPKRPQTQKEAKISAAKHIVKTTKLQQPVRVISVSNSQKHLISDDKSQSSEIKSKFTSVKARYMDPIKPRTTSEIPVKTIKKLSSSENSRDSSPAFNKNKKHYDIVKKASNLSLDSLQSPLKSKRIVQSNNPLPKKDSEMSMDSLSESLRSTSKTGRTSSESLIKRTSLNEKDSARSSARLSKTNITKQSTNNQNQVVQQQRSFLSQKSREILAKRSQQQPTRKLSTNSNSSIATKSTKSSSPRMFLPINKSHSTTAVITSKKVYNTTLHLRKTSKLPEPIDTLKTTNNLNKTKTQKKEVPSVKLLKEKEKENDHKKGSAKSNKSTNNKLDELKNDNNIITAESLSNDESYEVKMARSNTFSKEAPDNPIELLKTMK
ncbi:serine-rich adhesin for platelets isoform X2 [Chironomus tepperi]|uniref:serine-rich adhesin for platelets isoform X2 n=1 Tax=Chironomus tepperi TaxID=113505 RepID=UPI00391F895D